MSYFFYFKVLSIHPLLPLVATFDPKFSIVED